jgi:hypothetical protein
MVQRKVVLGTQPTGAASSSIMRAFVGLLRAFVNRYIVTEHTCAPPEDGRRWTAVPTHTVARRASGYQCPECGQNFLANNRHQAEFGSRGRTFQRESIA